MSAWKSPSRCDGRCALFGAEATSVAGLKEDMHVYGVVAFIK